MKVALCSTIEHVTDGIINRSAATFLEVCENVVPGLVIAGQGFGHLPAVFLPAGPLISRLGNDDPAGATRQRRTFLMTKTVPLITRRSFILGSPRDNGN